MGLLVLQRLDFLRPQLSAAQPRKRGRGPRLHPEPGAFIVDDVAFIHQRHGFAIGEAIARKGIRKKFYLETRGDVLLRNKEVFQFWKKLGVTKSFSESRRSTRMACESFANASRSGAISRR